LSTECASCHTTAAWAPAHLMFTTTSMC
jgi:hypothetical protein